jgi:hypothetical protein
MQQQLSIPPTIMVQRFCSIEAETLSSQAQTTFMPPGHFEKVIVQRGTIIMFAAGEVGAWVPIVPVGPAMGMPVIGIPGIAIPARSITFAVAILISFGVGSCSCHPPPSGEPAHCGNLSAGFQVREYEFQRDEDGHPDQLGNITRPCEDCSSKTEGPGKNALFRGDGSPGQE